MLSPVPNTPNNAWYQKQHHVRIPAAAESKAFLDAYYTGQGAGSPAGLFAAGEQGAWLDIEPFNLNWRRNLWNDSEAATGFTPTNAQTAVEDNYVFAGRLCTKLDFASVGPFAHAAAAYEGAMISGQAYMHTVEVALSRPLVNAEQIRVQISQPLGGSFCRVNITPANCAAVTGVWGTVKAGSFFAAPDSDTGRLVLFASTVPETPLTIYVRNKQLELGAVATEYQQIIGDGSSQVVSYNPDATLYQDDAGTVYVSAIGQPVGYVRDKSGRGHHAIQPVAGDRPIYGIAPRGRVRNLCSYTEDVQNAAWLKPSATVVNNVDGTAWSVAPNTTPADDVSQALPAAYGTSVTLSLKAKANGTSALSLTLADSGAANKLVAVFDVTAGMKTANGVLTGAGWSGNATTISGPDVNGYCTVTMTVTVAALYPVLQSILPVVASPDGVKGLLIKDVQYELGSVATAYQKVVSIYEVTEAGQPSAHCLYFDGIDDFLVTDVIPFSPSTTMFMSTGVAPTDYTAQRATLMISNSIAGNQGIAFIQTPAASLVTAFNSKGTLNVTRPLGPNKAPNEPVVVSGVADISAPTATIRVNGVPGQLGTGSQGIGTYLDYPLYLGSIGGGTMFLSGRFFGAIVSNKAATTDDILNAEAWLNARMAL